MIRLLKKNHEDLEIQLSVLPNLKDFINLFILYTDTCISIFLFSKYLASSAESYMLQT